MLGLNSGYANCRGRSQGSSGSGLGSVEGGSNKERENGGSSGGGSDGNSIGNDGGSSNDSGSGIISGSGNGDGGSSSSCGSIIGDGGDGDSSDGEMVAIITSARHHEKASVDASIQENSRPLSVAQAGGVSCRCGVATQGIQ